MITDEQGAIFFGGLAAAKYPLMATKLGLSDGALRRARGVQHGDCDRAGSGYNPSGFLSRSAARSCMEWFQPMAGCSAPGGRRVGDAVFSARTSLGEGTATFHEDTQTDDTGAYEFGGLAEGEYLIAVSAHPWCAMHRASGNGGTDPAKDLDVAYPVTYFDSTTEEASATCDCVAAWRSRRGGYPSARCTRSHHFSEQRKERRGSRWRGRSCSRSSSGAQFFYAESVGFMDALKTGTATSTAWRQSITS